MTLKKIDIGEITKAVKNCTTPKQKTIIEKIDISSKWQNQLPLYAQLYSNLNEQGKKEMVKQLITIGKIIDKCKQLKKRK
jgi:hypothetical protein